MKHDRQLGVHLAQLFEEFQAGCFRQQDVEQHRVGLSLALQAQTFFGRRGGNDLNVAAFKGFFNQMPHGTVIVNDKNFRHHASPRTIPPLSIEAAI